MTYLVMETDVGWCVVRVGLFILLLASFADRFSADRLAAELNR